MSSNLGSEKYPSEETGLGGVWGNFESHERLLALDDLEEQTLEVFVQKEA